MPWERTREHEWVLSEPEAFRAVHEELDYAVELLNAVQEKLAEHLLRGIIEQHPLYLDAYYYLSLLFERTQRPLEAYLAACEAARIGLDALPDDFHWETAQLSWYVHENRPFMRAYHYLGLWRQRRGELDAATEIFQRLLSVCPSDNIGVRYLLPMTWLEQGKIRTVIQHCRQFQGDMAPEISYTYPLALILDGQLQRARPLLKEAKKQLPLVAKELLKKRHPKPRSYSPQYVTLGGADQAYDYWQHYGKYWSQSAEAMAALAEK